MSAEQRQSTLLETLVTLADTLVVGYDIIDLLQVLVEKCAVILDASDVGIILASGEQELELETVASTSERSRLLDIMQLRAGSGPCVQAYTSGVVISVPDVSQASARWPDFVRGALSLGFGSSHSVPLRLRDSTLGALNIFREHPGVLSDADRVAAKALADVATIGILQERAIREESIARAQLQHALDSRVVIEQAKGVLAHTHGVDMDSAFSILRNISRSTGTPIGVTARGIVDRSIQSRP